MDDGEQSELEIQQDKSSRTETSPDVSTQPARRQVL